MTSQVAGDKSTPEAIDHLETGLLAKKKQGVTNQWNRPRVVAARNLQYSWSESQISICHESLKQSLPTRDSDLCGYQADLISFVVDSALGCPRLSLTRQFWKACSRLGLVPSLPLEAQRSHWRSVLNWPWACTKIFGQFARNSSRIGMMLQRRVKRQILKGPKSSTKQ